MTCKQFASLIDSYLNGNLSGEKQEAFERHYFECDHCYLELKIAERLHFQKVLIALKGKDAPKEMPFVSAWKWKPLLAAASVLLVVLLSIFIIDHSQRSKMLYTISAFSPPVYMKSETRDAAAVRETDKAFAEAMRYYNRKDYTRSLEILKRIQDASQNPQVIFFKGICFLLTDELKDAVKKFDTIIENMNPSYYDEAIYYKAIALLRLDKKGKALEQLNHLAEMFSPYAPKANALIKKIADI